jgi:choline dehydrogenase
LNVAYRLAENGTYSVAVVEAGGFYEQDNGNTSVVPAYCPRYGAVSLESAAQYPLVDWGFVTEAESGLGGRRLHYGRGKTLGGRYDDSESDGCNVQVLTADFVKLGAECHDL